MKKTFFLSTIAVSSLLAQNYSSELKSLNSHFSKNFQSTIVAPGTSSGSFKTVDGNTSFQANMTCEAASISVSDISYTGSSDISINIKMDLNYDGIKETNNNLNNVSGICADGVIKCDINTWNNCSYYNYSFSSSGISVNLSTNQNNTPNCYCINSSCGSPSVNNKKAILDDITAGVYNILQANLPRFVLTQANNDGVTSSIYGENQDECGNYQVGSRDIQMDSNSIINQGEAQLASNQTDPDTPAGFILNATNNELSFDYTSEKNELKTKTLNTPAATESNKIISANGETFDMSNIEDSNPIQYCQVEKLVSNSQVYTDQSTSYTSNTANTQMAEYELRECTGVDYSVCPIDSGESVKYQCGDVNQDSFNESISGINAVQSMANDMTCSQ